MSSNAKLLLHTLGSDAHIMVHCDVDCSQITLFKKSFECLNCSKIMKILFPSIVVDFCSVIDDEKLYIVAGTVDGFVGYVIIPLHDLNGIDIISNKSQLDIPFTSIDEIISSSVIKVLDSKNIIQLYVDENHCKIESVYIIPATMYICISSEKECFILCNESVAWTEKLFKKVSLNLCRSTATSMIFIDMSHNNEGENSLISHICGKDFALGDSNVLFLGCHDGAIYFLNLTALFSQNTGTTINLEYLRKGSSSYKKIDKLVFASNACASYLCLISADDITLLGVRVICSLIVGDERIIPLNANLANASSFCFIQDLNLLLYLNGGRLHCMSLLETDLNSSKFSEIIFDSDVKVLNCISSCPYTTRQYLAFGTSDSISVAIIESRKYCIGEEALKHICNTSFQSGPMEVLHSFINYKQIPGIDEARGKKRKKHQDTSNNVQNSAMLINEMITAINEHVEREELYRLLLTAIELETLQLTSLINVLQSNETLGAYKAYNNNGVHQIWGNVLNISTDVNVLGGSNGQDASVSVILTSASSSIMKALHGKMVNATITTISQLLDQDDGCITTFSSPLLFDIDNRKNEKNTNTYTCEITVPLVNCYPSIHIIDLYVNVNFINPELLFKFSSNYSSNESSGINLPIFGVDGKESCYCPQDCGINIPLFHGEISLEQFSKCLSSKSCIDQIRLMSIVDDAKLDSSLEIGHTLHIMVPHLSNKPNIKNDALNSIQKIKSIIESSKQLHTYGTNSVVETINMLQPLFTATNTSKNESIEAFSTRLFETGNTTAVLVNSVSIPLLSSIHADTRKVVLNLLDMCTSEAINSMQTDSSDTLRMLREDIYSTPQEVRKIMVECSKIEESCNYSSNSMIEDCDTPLRTFLDVDKSGRSSVTRLVHAILELYKKLRESGI